MVYVINKEGKPLMPCKEAKARHLLKQNKARVVNKIPFTIQLLFDCDNIVQDVNIGIDSGSKHIGVSATTKTDVLYEADVELRNDIKALLESRKALRSTRRCRKLRYRKARYLNRKHELDLTPSIRQKIETHLTVIANVCKILPINKIIIEVAKFDIMKIQNPVIERGQYSYGEQYGFWNVREYVLWRDNHTCQCCKGKSKDSVLNVHHIESRKTGGNAPNNLITLCKTCHDGVHSGSVKLLNISRGEIYRDAAFMNTLQRRIYNILQEIYCADKLEITFGYKTKHTRILNNLAKEHYIDARCISSNPLAKSNGMLYYLKKVRRHCRHMYKDKTFKGGIRRRNQCPYNLYGYHRYDIVKYNGKLYYINSLRENGFPQIKDLMNKSWKKSITYKKLNLVQVRSGYIITSAKIAS